MASYLGVTSIVLPPPDTTNSFINAIFQLKSDPYNITTKIHHQHHHLHSVYQTNPAQLNLLGPPSNFSLSSSSLSPSLHYDINSRTYLPLKSFSELKLTIGMPIYTSLTSSPNAPMIALLSTAYPHLSSIQYLAPQNKSHYNQSSSELDYSNYRTPQIIPLSSIGQSNACSIQNGFILPPDSCSCNDLIHMTKSANTPSQWAKCLYCYLHSRQTHDLVHLFQQLLFPLLYINPYYPNLKSSHQLHQLQYYILPFRLMPMPFDFVFNSLSMILVLNPHPNPLNS